MLNSFFHKIKHYRARTLIKKGLIRGITLLFPLFNLFYLPIIKRYFIKKIRTLPPRTQIFLVTRLDLGHHMLNLHYAELWQQEREQTAVCILTPTFQREKTLASIISPDSIIISFDNILSRLFSALFFHVTLYTKTYMKIYAELLTIKTNAIYIIEAHPDNHMNYFSGSYQQIFDPNIALLKNQTKSFLENYVQMRSEGYYRSPHWEDYRRLCESKSKSPEHPLLDVVYSLLSKKLNIARPFFILNINCKLYSSPSSSRATRRRINHPERYSHLVDFLIGRGYDVVLQGREEQPNFNPRPHFIDYAHSNSTSIENDLALFSQARGVISSKSGTEIFASIFDLPLLTLNFTEPAISIPLGSYRYYFKHPILKKNHQFLSWKDFLFHPSFFDQGLEENSGVIYQELSKEELVNATTEFLSHIENNIPWTTLTLKQQEYKKALEPFHLDQYLTQGVPCSCYLEENEKKTKTI